MNPTSANRTACAREYHQQGNGLQIDWNLLLREEQAGLFQLWVHFNDDLQFHRRLQNSLPYPAAIAMLKETENVIAIRQVLHPVANDVRLKYYIRTPSEPVYVLYIQHADTSSAGASEDRAGGGDATEWEFDTYYGFVALRQKIEELERAIKHHKFTHKLRVRVLLSGTLRDAILIRDAQTERNMHDAPNNEPGTDDDLPDLESHESAEDM